jgi:hypothetical protein
VELSEGSTSIYKKVALLSALKLLRAHLRCLSATRVSLNLLVGDDGYEIFKNLPEDYFSKIEPHKESDEEEKKDDEDESAKTKKENDAKL